MFTTPPPCTGSSPIQPSSPGMPPANPRGSQGSASRRPRPCALGTPLPAHDHAGAVFVRFRYARGATLPSHPDHTRDRGDAISYRHVWSIHCPGGAVMTRTRSVPIEKGKTFTPQTPHELGITFSNWAFFSCFSATNRKIYMPIIPSIIPYGCMGSCLAGGAAKSG